MRREPPVRLRSARPADEVVRLIESQTVGDHLAMWFKVKPFWKPIVGRVRGSRFRLRQHRNFGNSGGPLLYGEVVADGAGSEIRGRFRTHPLARVFLLVWLAGLAAFAVIGALQSPSPGSDIPRWVFPFAAVAFGGFAFLLVRFSWWLGKNERRAIWSFLEALTTPEAKSCEDENH